MLHRAASSAYSWWWASHIRTKQSKWLDQNLLDMDEKVQNVLKLIEEDGDSFIKKAEMYYKRRPELINFVEESYRGYRALAERYDRISKELQNANNTIAYVFPEQVQFSMEEEEDEVPSPKVVPNKVSVPDVFKGNIPKVPKISKEIKGFFSSDKKKSQQKNSSKTAPAATKVANKSGLSKKEGLKEIDKLQKEILGLQTEKEFVKSSYEAGLAKYWEIDKQMREMQDKICNLQDEFGAGAIIEDNEARTLMASSALKSCQETLAQLQQKQEKSAEAAVVERKRINDAREKLQSFKEEFLQVGADPEKSQYKDESKKKELKNSIAEVISGMSASLSVTELAEGIDELVDKVISMEGSVSSQTALIERLRSEIDELHAQIRSLQDDKASLISGSEDLSEKIKEMEEKLEGIENLNQSVEDQNANIQKHFTEARCNLNNLSEKLSNVTPDEELQVSSKMKATPIKSKEKKKGKKSKDKKSKKELKAAEAASSLEDAVEEPHKLVSDEKLKVSDESSKGREAALAPVEGVQGPKNVNSDEKVEVSGKSNEESKETEAASIPDKGFEEPQNVQSDEKLEDFVESNKKSKEIEAALIPEKGIEEPQKVQSDEKVDVSGKSNEESHGAEAASIPEEPQNVQSDEKLDVSDKPSKKGKKELPLTNDDGIEASQNVTLDKKLKVPDKPNKELRRQVASTSEDSLQDSKNLRLDGKLQALDPSQKEIESTAGAVPPIEFKEKEENDIGTSNSDQREITSQLKAINGTDDPLRATHDLEIEEVNKEVIPIKEDDPSTIETLKEESAEEDEPDWKNDTENKEYVLLMEYNTVLCNYKEVKKKLEELENKNDNSLFDTMVQLRELKNANAKKDEQIKYLRKKLSLLESGLNNEAIESPMKQNELRDDTDEILMFQTELSEIEQRFRSSIDEVLEENLNFWFRFSTQLQEIQRFDSEVNDLQSDVSKLQVKLKKLEGSNSTKYSLKSDAKPLYKHLREIYAELNVWLENGMVLKDDLKSRFSSLCDIQDEITTALKESAEDIEDFKFTSYQAAKFQGEILNMKQENNKVADELQAGLDHVTSLQLEVDRTLVKLNEEFKLSGSKNQQTSIQLQHCDTRSRIPLRSFIFGAKPKKQKHSIFSIVHPALQKKYNALKSSV